MFADVNISINMCQWYNGLGFKESFQLFGPQKIPLKCLLLETATGSSVTLISEDDYGNYRLDRDLYDIDYGFVNKMRSLSVLEKEVVTKIKFFYGETGYSKEERKILKTWIRKHGPERLKKFFEEYALAGFPHKTERYWGSWLQKQLTHTPK